MSTGVRIPHARGVEIALEVAGLLGIDHTDPANVLAGSLRRQCPDVGDIEIVVPMPSMEMGDPLYRAIGEHYEPPIDASNLFLAGSQPVCSRVVKGHNRNFRYCQLSHLAPEGAIKVELYRYDPGPAGNFGWILMIRTGPAEFGRLLLGDWLRARGGGNYPASEAGYPLDCHGRRVPVPSEKDAFRMCGRPWLRPEERPGVVRCSSILYPPPNPGT